MSSVWLSQELSSAANVIGGGVPAPTVPIALADSVDVSMPKIPPKKFAVLCVSQTSTCPAPLYG